MRALVTGATGFIGAAIAKGLVEAGWEVRVLVRYGSQEKVDPKSGWQVVVGDLLSDPARVRQAVEGSDVVIHAAAIRDRWGTPDQDYFMTNVQGTRWLLDSTLGQAKRFVYISSVGVYGYPGVFGIDENYPLEAANGQSGYHRSKAVAEEVVRSHADEIETVIIRPTITYGPGDRDGMVTRLVQMLQKGQYVQIGSGNNHFHLTYIDDLVRGVVLACSKPEAVGETFILAGPESTSCLNFVHLIQNKLGKKLTSRMMPEKFARACAWLVEQAFEVSRDKTREVRVLPPITPAKIDTLCRNRSFVSQKAQQLLGYQPSIHYADGLDKTIAWMVANGLLRGPEKAKRQTQKVFPVIE